MKDAVIQKLLDLNQRFYDGLADPFAQSRQRPQPGFYRLLEFLPQPCQDLLDVGCGDGRFGRFLYLHQAIEWYTGVDFSQELLSRAATHTEGDYFQRNIGQPGCLKDLGQFDVVACLAALQHIPARKNRLRLLREMRDCVAPGGRLLLSTWQFAENERQRRKIRDWNEVGLGVTDVEAGDYLLSWQRTGFGLRYVAMIDASETDRLAGEAGLQIVAQFRSDGREGNLSLYTVLRTK